ncbi:phosphoribosyltransferase family protein [Nocardioides sp. NPDC057767]|uniref:phosphoribosyltransferase family protein n=1 Tax=unclassified Nocardioides TaxID=2615069 RepID=UPI00366E99A7
MVHLARGEFEDRVDAGRRLGKRLAHLRAEAPVVLGLPRGGVPVAFEVAQELQAPLDVIVVRKLGLPFQSELAMGAIGEGGYEVLDRPLIAHTGVTESELHMVEARERSELESRVTRLRRGRDPLDLADRVAVIVDDGIATGATARVACEVARHKGARRVVLAAPVGPPEVRHGIAGADEVVVLETPDPFLAVGYHYRDFAPTSDDEVVTLLAEAARRDRRRAVEAAADCDIDVDIPAGRVVLQGHLHLPERPAGVVVFAHGSGSSRHSPRNRYVASVLYDAGLGTLLLDLLTPEEERDRANVFDIQLLADRLGAAVRWVRRRSDAVGASVGLFGASTGAGAALWAAADSDLDIAAVVSRGGRPDLAVPRLGSVSVPTLLIVGGADTEVLRLNQEAAIELGGPSRVSVVPGATHLFEEPGALEEAARLARDWFRHHLVLTNDSRHGTTSAGTR